MASSSTPRASSSTSNCDRYNYDVFLSFRGEDTRYNFTDHLYATLIAHGIHTFRDEEELEKGGDIASDLLRAIKESKIFIIIFSKNYADSKWCLKELVKILDCMTDKKSTVLPVFYHVEPRDVRNQRGSFEDAFLDHAKDADQEKEKTIETWKNALKTAASLKGYHVTENQSEAEFIQRIREDILTRLNRNPLYVGENIVGMDFHLEQLKSQIKIELDEVHMVGIWGIGGIGKTTIAMAIYNNISSQFDGSSFLKNVGGNCEDGLVKLQQQLLKDILNVEGHFNNTNKGINVIKEKLRSKRVLIVLDDVANYSELEYLVGKHDGYGAKRLIIITTREKNLLEQCGVNAVYEVKKLKHEKSIELFNWWAFKQNTPTLKFKSLSDRIVKYVDGLPIALQVLGRFLLRKSTTEWKSALDKLEKIPDRTVQSVLKVSYDKLDDTEQRMFLDIACFFRGKDKAFVSRIFGSYAEIGIKVLHDRCLITISENKLDMHDLLQQMGREIVRQQCIEEPGKRSRLWDPNEVNDVIERNTGTEAIQGLFVEISTSNMIRFSPNFFTKLNKLRLLKVYYRRSVAWNKTEVCLPMDLEFPSLELRYLYFERYPLESLPTNLNAKNLVELNLKQSSIKQPWKKNEILDNLKVINLSYSEDLVEIPDFSSVPNLEILILKGCTSLVSLPESIWNLSETVIKKLPSPNGHLKALKYLNLKGCSNLKSFPEIKDDMENLERLDLSATTIKELPSSIGHLKALKHLNLKSCTELVSLPESIWNLSSLETLDIRECPKLESLEVILFGEFLSDICLILKGGMWWSKDLFSSLKTLNLQHNKMESCIRNFRGRERGISSLMVSSFGNFNPMARGIPSDIFHQSSLKSLSIYNCNLMEEGIPSDIWNLSSLVELSLTNCNLMDGEFINHVCHLSSLKWLNLEGNHFSSIPAGISRLSHLKGLNLSHCNKLQKLPKLPLSLRFLDVHCSDGALSSPSLLSIPSLLNYFKSESLQEESMSVGNSYFGGKGMSIVIPRSSGIVKGIKNQRSYEVKIELPQNWYENNDLLGFVVCCVFVPMLDSFPVNIYCELAIRGNYASKYMMDKLSFCVWRCCNEHNDDSVSDQVWVIYYPKDAIKEEYHSNQWTHFMASFHGHRILLVEECGIHPIYCCFKCQRNEECERKLCLKGEAINELPIIDCPSVLGSLCLRECRNLESLPSTICEFKSLIILFCSGCSQLKIFPEILETMENLRELHLDGTGIEELPSSIQRLRGLQRLNLAYCNNLVSLPETFCYLKSLVFLSCRGCSQLKSFPKILENMENLRVLYLDGTAIKELPASIEHLGGLQRLNLAYCNNLVSLPETLCYLKSLVLLSCIGCWQLKSFPEILENMENLRELYLDGTAIKELPASIEHLGGLQVLHLSKCRNLVSLPETFLNLRLLKDLNVNLCSKLEKFPENLGSLQCLEVLGVSGFDSNQVLGAIQNDVCYMSSWEALNQSINYFSSIPASISQLSKLRILYLSHCQKLLQIPELPPSLRFLDVHACPCLETLLSPSSLLGFSLFRCFKSAIEEFECESAIEEFECGSNRHPPVITIIISENNGIPEWIRQQKKGSEITIELPMDWYMNNDFLGFALYFVYVPPHIESEEDFSLKCELTFHRHRYEFLDDLPFKFWSMDGLSSKSWPIGELSFKDRYSCCHNGGESNRVWVAYYPKVAIRNEYWSNEWRHLKASFHGHFGTERVKVEECGFHLIYMPNTHVQSSFGTNHWPRLLRENTGFNVKGSRDDAEDHPTETHTPKDQDISSFQYNTPCCTLL